MSLSYERRLNQRAILALGGRCVKCGEDELIVLDIDHIRGGGVAERKLSRRAYIRDIVKGLRHDEFQVLCSNDHRRKTYATE
jgi:hypothetical protein